ncbi:uncharacterized protein LOC129772802 [Toxorhynchites rutilus septentrionalis]|uniref:uncharacterized protein LOC129772802 n=1 Tax=Toxorhynchites rutilus septentrionalis TaxID=329112 RepID=UPI00247A9326|nr:uncharacterized protein LOC129772802 [Toxorhynchites rutilus septentrionalis]
MATVIRIKRRVDEEPLDALVLNCKKRRVDLDTDSLELQFAGTIEEADNIPTHLQQSLTPEKSGEAVYRDHLLLTLMCNELWSLVSSHNPLRVVNCTRSLPQRRRAFGGTTIVDMERASLDSPGLAEPIASTSKLEPMENKIQSFREKNQYVYDLYISKDLRRAAQYHALPRRIQNHSVGIHADTLFNTHRKKDEFDDIDAFDDIDESDYISKSDDSTTDDEDSEDPNDGDDWYDNRVMNDSCMDEMLRDFKRLHR